ncbi:MAG TPA: helix-turn-helix domain-containing protein [Vicinamibacterales bacterium]|jgi:excisionase family DNA binding protein
MAVTYRLPATVETHDPDEWLKLREAAREAKTSEKTLRRMIAAGLLKHARVGAGRGRIRIRRSWIAEAMTRG